MTRAWFLESMEASTLSRASGNVSGGNVKIARFSVTFHASGNDSNTLRAIAVIFPFVPRAWE